MKVFLRLLFACQIMLVAQVTLSQENLVQIVASHSILADVVQQIAGEVTEVRAVMPAGADPHGFQPVPADIVALAEADIIFINGAFFEEGVLEAIENASSNMNIITVSSCVEMIAFSGVSHEHEDEAEHEASNTPADIDTLCEQHDSELENINLNLETIGRLHTIDCDSGQCDPHVWTLPQNVMLWALMIRDSLIAIDPDNAETYTNNAETYLAELDSLLKDVIEPLIESVPPEKRLLVTNHDSMGYFAQNYGFEIVSTIIPGGGSLTEPGASEIVATIQLIQQQNVPAIFAETTLGDDVIRQIANETGIEIFTLYSGSLSADETANNYLDYMRYNVTTIVTALNNK